MRCQRSGRSAVSADLPLGFLDLVFAEVELTGGGGRANVVGGECLGDGDEADRGRVASGPAGGARDAIANAVQPGAERGGIDHYFFSCVDEPFRGRGVRSFRRELQIGLELGRRLGEVAIVHERHAELVVRFGVIRVCGRPRQRTPSAPRRSCRRSRG